MRETLIEGVRDYLIVSHLAVRDCVIVSRLPSGSARWIPSTLVNFAKGRVGDWDLKVDPAVRSLIVVMLDELSQYTIEMALAADQQPVEALSPGCPHEPFGKRVRPGRPHGCLDDPSAGRLHHLVEGPDELGVAVPDQEPDGSALVFDGGGQVPDLLSNPGPDRVGCDPSQEHLPTVEVDEEQHIEPPQRNGVDVEEVASEYPTSLRSKEL